MNNYFYFIIFAVMTMGSGFNFVINSTIVIVNFFNVIIIIWFPLNYLHHWI